MPLRPSIGGQVVVVNVPYSDRRPGRTGHQRREVPSRSTGRLSVRSAVSPGSIATRVRGLPAAELAIHWAPINSSTASACLQDPCRGQANQTGPACFSSPGSRSSRGDR